METPDIRKLKIALRRFEDHRARMKDGILAAGQDLLNRCAAAHKEVFPDEGSARRCGCDEDWVTRTDRITFECKAGDIYLLFRERGCCGERDECHLELRFDESFMTPEGRAAFVGMKKREWLAKVGQAGRNEEQVKARRILTLEAELSALRSR